MRRLSVTTLTVAVALIFGTIVHAQQPPAAPAAPPPPPEYGSPVTLAQAMKIAAAAQANSEKLGYHSVISIVGPGGDLIYFLKMDGAQYGSIAISQQKAKTAATYRRPTKVFEDVVAGGGIGLTALTLPGVIASAGGLPIIINGKIAGAIGVSGAPRGVIDQESSQAGLDALK